MQKWEGTSGRRRWTRLSWQGEEEKRHEEGQLSRRVGNRGVRRLTFCRSFSDRLLEQLVLRAHLPLSLDDSVAEEGNLLRLVEHEVVLLLDHDLVKRAHLVGAVGGLALLPLVDVGDERVLVLLVFLVALVEHAPLLLRVDLALLGDVVVWELVAVVAVVNLHSLLHQTKNLLLPLELALLLLGHLLAAEEGLLVDDLELEEVHLLCLSLLEVLLTRPFTQGGHGLLSGEAVVSKGATFGCFRLVGDGGTVGDELLGLVLVLVPDPLSEGISLLLVLLPYPFSTFLWGLVRWWWGRVVVERWWR